MGPALREAWLWLLLAFVLGVVIGYFLRRYTVAEDAPHAAAPAADESLARKAEAEIAEAERADTETDEGAPQDAAGSATVGETDDEPEPSGTATETEGVEEKSPEAHVTSGVDLTQEERELLEKDAAAFHALAQLSQGQLTDSHGVTRVVAAEEAAQAGEEPEEQRPRGEAPPEQRVDTHQTFMPVVEPLRVPGGRNHVKPAQSTPETEPASEPATKSPVEPETPVDGPDPAVPASSTKGKKPRRRDS